MASRVCAQFACKKHAARPLHSVVVFGLRRSNTTIRVIKRLDFVGFASSARITDADLISGLDISTLDAGVGDDEDLNFSKLVRSFGVPRTATGPPFH